MSAVLPPKPARPSMEPITLISGISALLQATQTWVQYRDSRRASVAFKEEIEKAPHRPEIINEAATISSMVPQPILDRLVERAEECWEKYGHVLDGGYLPEEVDEHTENVKACVCRELRRIKSLNNAIPGGKLSEFWDAHCIS